MSDILEAGTRVLIPRDGKKRYHDVLGTIKGTCERKNGVIGYLVEKDPGFSGYGKQTALLYRSEFMVVNGQSERRNKWVVGYFE